MAFPNGYAACRKLTFDVRPTAVLTDFPNLVLGTYAELKSVANGGQVNNTVTLLAQTVPADVIFTSDAAGTVLLSWEIESWNATTGAIVAWVKFSRSSSADDVIYMWAGKPTVTTYQCTASATWDAYYTGRWAMPNGATISGLDSTANHNDGALSVTPPTAIGGKVDGGGAFDANKYMYGTESNFPALNKVTISVWLYLMSTTSAQGWVIIKGGPSSGELGFFVQTPPNTGSWTVRLAGNYGSGWIDVSSTSAVPDPRNAWHKYTAVYNGANVTFYFDGAQLGVPVAKTGNISNAYSTFWIGLEGCWNSQICKGYMDDLRVSSIDRSTDWEAHEYLQQSQLSAWYSTEVMSAGGFLNRGYWWNESVRNS